MKRSKSTCFALLLGSLFFTACEKENIATEKIQGHPLPVEKSFNPQEEVFKAEAISPVQVEIVKEKMQSPKAFNLRHEIDPEFSNLEDLN